MRVPYCNYGEQVDPSAWMDDDIFLILYMVISSFIWYNGTLLRYFQKKIKIFQKFLLSHQAAPPLE